MPSGAEGQLNHLTPGIAGTSVATLGKFCLHWLKSTQPLILNWWINRVPAGHGRGDGGSAASAGWQVTLCDRIWHAGFRSSAVLLAQTAIRCLYLFSFTGQKAKKIRA